MYDVWNGFTKSPPVPWTCTCSEVVVTLLPDFLISIQQNNVVL